VSLASPRLAIRHRFGQRSNRAFPAFTAADLPRGTLHRHQPTAIISHGILHRDLKPENVMIVPDLHALGGEPTKLLDFGIAKL